MDTPCNSIDFLELPIVATLRSRSLPVVVMGDFLVVLFASALAAAYSSTAPAATATTPPMSASALATRGAFSSDVPGEAIVVATVRADPVSPVLLSYDEVPHLAAILEQVVAFRVDAAPRIFLPLRGRSWLGLLGERLGDEDALVGSRV